MPDQFIRIGQSFKLDQDEVQESVRLSLFELDEQAAWKLRNYYRYYVKDAATARIWLKRAAELGHQKARKIIDEERYKLTRDERILIYPDVYKEKAVGGVPVDIWSSGDALFDPEESAE